MAAIQNYLMNSFTSSCKNPVSDVQLPKSVPETEGKSYPKNTFKVWRILFRIYILIYLFRMYKFTSSRFKKRSEDEVAKAEREYRIGKDIIYLLLIQRYKVKS